MKPLGEVKTFLKRFDNFKNGEIRGIEIISSSIINITLTAQDNAKENDWISLKLECNGVYDASLLSDDKIKYINMDDGITIIKDTKGFAFGIGECYNIESIKNSSLYVACASMKYEESSF